MSANSGNDFAVDVIDNMFGVLVQPLARVADLLVHALPGPAQALAQVLEFLVQAAAKVLEGTSFARFGMWIHRYVPKSCFREARAELLCGPVAPWSMLSTGFGNPDLPGNTCFCTVVQQTRPR